MSADFRAHVAAVLGFAPESIEPGKLMRFGPGKSAWCKLFDDQRNGVCGDFKQNINTSTWSATKEKLSPAEYVEQQRQIRQAIREREAEQMARFRENRARIAELLAWTVEVSAGDPVARYFDQRGLAGAWNFAPCLRLHPGLPYIHEGVKIGTFPAMIAPLQSPEGVTVALHRTYLTQDGQKAPVPVVKKLTPAGGSLRGAAIRLQPMRDGVLGVSEGIETAMASAMASSLPVWSTYCAHGLATFDWPTGVRKLVVFGDNDTAGRDAARTLHLRAAKAGKTSSMLLPTVQGMDWADVYAEGARA